VIPQEKTVEEIDADSALATPIPVIVTAKVLQALRTLDVTFARVPTNFAWTMITLAAEAVSLAGSALEAFCADDAIEL
jgi:hypothetical protein